MVSSSRRAFVLMDHICFGCFGTFSDGRRFVAIVARFVVVRAVAVVVSIGDRIVVVIVDASDEIGGRIVCAIPPFIITGELAVVVLVVVVVVVVDAIGVGGSDDAVDGDPSNERCKLGNTTNLLWKFSSFLVRFWSMSMWRFKSSMFGEVSGKIGGFLVLVVVADAVAAVVVLVAVPCAAGDATFNANGIIYFRSI